MLSSHLHKNCASAKAAPPFRHPLQNFQGRSFGPALFLPVLGEWPTLCRGMVARLGGRASARGLSDGDNAGSAARLLCTARVDLTSEGKALRDALMLRVERIPFPEYRKYSRQEMCWHDPHYPAGEWRCPLRKHHADFHRYVPVELISWADAR